MLGFQVPFQRLNVNSILARQPSFGHFAVTMSELGLSNVNCAVRPREVCVLFSKPISSTLIWLRVHEQCSLKTKILSFTQAATFEASPCE
jgi:hypothetical protein